MIVNIPFDPKKFGAVTSSDTAAFLIGAGIGGIADAAVNAFGFVEPFMAASLCGTVALGIKKALWDGTGHFGVEGRREVAELELEVADLDLLGEYDEAARLRTLIAEGRKRGLSAEQIRARFKKRPRLSRAGQSLLPAPARGGAPRSSNLD
jgi:hypothetical protein